MSRMIAPEQRTLGEREGFPALVHDGTKKEDRGWGCECLMNTEKLDTYSKDLHLKHQSPQRKKKNGTKDFTLLDNPLNVTILHEPTAPHSRTYSPVLNTRKLKPNQFVPQISNPISHENAYSF